MIVVIATAVSEGIQTIGIYYRLLMWRRGELLDQTLLTIMCIAKEYSQKIFGDNFVF